MNPEKDLWEEHGEWAAGRVSQPPKKMGEGPLFEAQHRDDVINWLHNEPWYQKMMSRSPRWSGKLQEGQFGDG